MSGVEFIVGTILGGVPVVVMAFEKYQTLSNAVSTFRNPKEILRMQSKVGAQRTIFRNNAVNLLSSLMNNRELVHTWMAELCNANTDGGCSTPTEKFVLSDIYRDRISSLADTFSSCKSTLDEILCTVEKISKELASLAKAVGKSSEHDMIQPVSGKKWLAEMSGRIKLVFRKTGLLDAIEDLRNLNADFSVMTNQIVITLDQVKNAQTNSDVSKGCPGRASKRTASNINQIEAYKRVRQASSLLYDTLEKNWTCQSGEHGSHIASVCCIEPDQIKTAQTVKFDVALAVEDDASYERKPMSFVSGPMWLEVEYLDDNKQNQITVIQAHKSQSFDALSTALTKLSTSPVVVASSSTHNGQASGKNSRKVRFSVLQSQPNQGHDPEIPVAGNPPAETGLLDLMVTADFCGHLHSQYKLCKSKHYFLGYLDGNNQQKLFIPPPERRLYNEPRTLSAIIAWISTASMHRSLPLPVALHIAGSLAASVLQFHSTPWLPERWKSDDVRFFSAGGLCVESELQLSHPNFQVHFPKPVDKALSQQSQMSDITLTDSEQTLLGCVRNELLFRLGIVLLEVGFSRSWPSLREEILTSKTLHVSRRTDYHIAQKLCLILQNQWGSRYSRIIRKCLSCDFGLNEPQDDLETSEELQAVFLVDVIVELQRLKERLQALD